MNAVNSSNILVEKYFKVTVFLLVVLFAGVSASCLINALSFIDKPFPGFLLYKNSMVPEVSLSGWSGYRSGLIKSYDKVIGIEGRELSPHQIYDLVESKPIGASVNYTVSRDDKLLNLSIPTMRFTPRDFVSIFCVAYVVGYIIFITGILVYLSKPDLLSGKVFFMFCFSMGIWFTCIFDTQSGYLLGAIPFIGWMFTPAFCISLAFIFPSTKKFIKNTSLIMLAPFLPSLALFIMHLSYFDSQHIWKKVDMLTWFYVLTATLAFVASATMSYNKPTFSLEKERARVILLGAFVGFLTPALCAFMITAFGISNLNNLAALVIFFPASIAYAIVKHKLFDIDVIIKRTLVYGTLTGVVVAFFALMVIGFNVAFANYNDWRKTAFFVTLISVFLVMALNPLKNQIQNFVDMTLFREKYDYHKTVEEISFAMISLLNLNEIAGKIISTIEQTMFSSPVYLVLINENSGDYEVYAKSRNAHARDGLFIKEDSDLVQLLNRHREEIFKEDLTAEEKYAGYENRLIKVYRDFEAALFSPLFFKERLIGILALGEKRSRLSYSSEDIKLLRILANQSAVAIENASAFKLVEDYAKKLEDTNKELWETQMQLIQSEKMSAIGQLAAGIAHEIRNPLNIIEGARYYLSQIINGENSNVIKEYLDYIKHEIDRTNRLIDNLLKFSKVETPRFEPVDINAIIENTLVLLRKQLNDNKVRLLTNFNYGIPNVVGDQNQLWQVFINIMANSIQAMPQGGELRIDTGLYYGSSERVFVSFTDTGVGIDKKDLTKIFNPFFTTKDTGTGLGLSISYRIIQEHKGKIVVSSDKGVGSTFVVELPVSYNSGEAGFGGAEDEGRQKSVSG